MRTALICLAVWLVGWQIWYRVECRLLEKSGAHFDKQARHEIWLGAITWPIQLLLLVTVGPFMLIAQKMNWWWWESKEDDEDDKDDER